MTRTEAVAAAFTMCISIAVIMLGIHNIDNAVNLAIFESISGMNLFDYNLMFGMSRVALYMVGATLTLCGSMALALSALVTGYKIRELKERV